MGNHPPPFGTGAGSRRILLVDDEAGLARMAALMLERDGHSTVIATSGEEAVQQLTKSPFDLVITDLGMGDGMNGWDLAAHVRDTYPGLPVILATGWGVQIDSDDAAARGVAAVLAKPYRMAALRQCVEDM